MGLCGQLRIPHIQLTPGHPGAGISPKGAEHHNRAAGHVLAAVVARPLNHRSGPGVAHRETLTDDPRHEQRPTRSAVQAGVSCAVGVFSSGDPRVHHNRPSAHALADIVVGRAVEHDRHTIDQKRTEALSGCSGQA